MAWIVSAYQFNRCLAIPSGLISDTKTDSRLYYGQSTTHWKSHQSGTCTAAAEHRLARPADGLLKTEPEPTTRPRLPQQRPTAEDQPHPTPRLLPMLLWIHQWATLMCKDTKLIYILYTKYIIYRLKTIIYNHSKQFSGVNFWLSIRQPFSYKTSTHSWRHNTLCFSYMPYLCAVQKAQYMVRFRFCVNRCFTND